MVISGGLVPVNQGFDGGQQLPVAHVCCVDIVGVAVQHTVGELAEFVMQLLGFGFEYAGAPGGRSGQSVRQPW